MTNYGLTVNNTSTTNGHLLRLRSSAIDRLTMTGEGNLGIGTNTPRAILDVGKYINNEVLGTVFGRLQEGNDIGDGTYLGVKGYGTQNSNFYGKSFSIIHNFYGTTNNSINFFRGGGVTGGFLTFNTNNNLERMRINHNGDVGIGTTDTQGFKLGVDGDVAALEVKIATYANWPDYVFNDAYNLPNLKEVEQQIKEKGHLKNIPSAEDIKKEGFFLGEMDSKLLQKIEELTLYTIEQQKEIERLKQLEEQYVSQEERIQKLEKIIANLLKQ